MNATWEYTQTKPAGFCSNRTGSLSLLCSFLQVQFDCNCFHLCFQRAFDSCTLGSQARLNVLGDTSLVIKAGDKLPTATFKSMSTNGPVDVSSDELFAGKTVVLFAVPGAFTPTCHLNHLPGFIENADAIKAQGVDAIAVVSVNDAFVMDAWAKDTGAGDKIQFLADGSAEFTKATGLELDASAFGMGIRSKRYSMIVKDGVVSSLNIEESPGEATTSSAANILSQL